MRGLFITGTDTGVGKTWVGCAIARHLTEQGLRVIPRKPVESGCRREGDSLVPADALALMQAANYTGHLDRVCPWRFEAPISPARAARLQQQPLTVAQLAEACRNQVADDDFLLVEGAGGFYSPLCDDGLNADLAQALELPMLLVAEDKLGCINQVLLTLEAMQNRKLPPLAVLLNRRIASPPDDTGMDNAGDLRHRLPCPLFAIDHAAQTLPPSLVDRLVQG